MANIKKIPKKLFIDFLGIPPLIKSIVFQKSVSIVWEITNKGLTLRYLRTRSIDNLIFISYIKDLLAYLKIISKFKLWKVFVKIVNF